MKALAPDWFGVDRRIADGPDRGSLRRGGRNQGSQRLAREDRSQRTPSAGSSLPPRASSASSDPTAAAARSAAGRCTKSGATPTSSTRTPASCCRPARSVVFNSVHLHANGNDTKAHLEVGFKFHPEGLQAEAELPAAVRRQRPDIDIRAHGGQQRVEAFFTLPQPTKISTFEPHMHAAGVRMCLEAIWGITRRDAQLLRLRPQLGPRLLVRRTTRRRCCRKARSCTSSATSTTRRPTGTSSIRETGPGSGHRSVDNMMINLMQAIYADRRAVPGRGREAPREAGSEGRPDGDRLSAVRRAPRRRAQTGRRAQQTRELKADAARERLRVLRGVRAGRGALAQRAGIVFDRPEHRAGLRRLGAERRRLLQPGVRLLQPELGGGDRRRRSAPPTRIEPGGPDQGQPTHFLPRRNRFVFRIRVPKDFGHESSSGR